MKKIEKITFVISRDVISRPVQLHGVDSDVLLDGARDEADHGPLVTP